MAESSWWDPRDWGKLEWILALAGLNQLTGDKAGLSKPQMSPQQDRMFGIQGDIAKLMYQDMLKRQNLTLREGASGNMEGPLVDALNMALSQGQQAMNTPRLRLQAPSFDPFGNTSQMQTFGPSTPKIAPVDLQIPTPLPPGGGVEEPGGNEPPPVELPPSPPMADEDVTWRTATGKPIEVDPTPIEEILDEVVDTGGTVVDAVGDFAGDLGSESWRLAQKVPGVVEDTVGAVGDFTGDLGSDAWRLAQRTPEVVEGAVRSVSDFTGDLGTAAWEAARKVPGTVEDASQYLGQLPGYIREGIEGFGEAAQRIPRGAADIGRYLGETARQIPGAVTTLADTVPGYLGEVLQQAGRVPGAVADVGREAWQLAGRAPGAIAGAIPSPDFSSIPGYIGTGIEGFTNAYYNTVYGGPEKVVRLLAKAPGTVMDAASQLDPGGWARSLASTIGNLGAPPMPDLSAIPGYIRSGLSGFESGGRSIADLMKGELRARDIRGGVTGNVPPDMGTIGLPGTGTESGGVTQGGRTRSPADVIIDSIRNNPANIGRTTPTAGESITSAVTDLLTGKFLDSGAHQERWAIPQDQQAYYDEVQRIYTAAGGGDAGRAAVRAWEASRGGTTEGVVDNPLDTPVPLPPPGGGTTSGATAAKSRAGGGLQAAAGQTALEEREQAEASGRKLTEELSVARADRQKQEARAAADRETAAQLIALQQAAQEAALPPISPYDTTGRQAPPQMDTREAELTKARIRTAGGYDNYLAATARNQAQIKTDAEKQAATAEKKVLTREEEMAAARARTAGPTKKKPTASTRSR